jgi:hypothetical protein
LAENNRIRWETLNESNQTQLQALKDSNQATRWLLDIGMTIIGLIVAYDTFFGGWAFPSAAEPVRTSGHAFAQGHRRQPEYRGKPNSPPSSEATNAHRAGPEPPPPPIV